MREIDAEITELLSPGDLDCDVACLVYDASNPDSFRFCATTYDVCYSHIITHIMCFVCIACIVTNYFVTCSRFAYRMVSFE